MNAWTHTHIHLQWSYEAIDAVLLIFSLWTAFLRFHHVKRVLKMTILLIKTNTIFV